MQRKRARKRSENDTQNGGVDTEGYPKARENLVENTHLRISHKGILERRLANRKQSPV